MSEKPKFSPSYSFVGEGFATENSWRKAPSYNVLNYLDSLDPTDSGLLKKHSSSTRPSTRERSIRLLKETIKTLPDEQIHESANQIKEEVLEAVFRKDENGEYKVKKETRPLLARLSFVKRRIVGELHLANMPIVQILQLVTSRYSATSDLTQNDIQRMYDEAILFLGIQLNIVDSNLVPTPHVHP